MTCECDCLELKHILANTKNIATLTLTDVATGLTTNVPTVTWNLKTRTGATSLGSGTVTNSGAGGIYTLTIPLSVASTAVPGTVYLLLIAIAASDFEKSYEVLSKLN